MTLNEDLIKLVSRFPDKQVDITSTESLIDFIQNLDVSKYHYEHHDNGIICNNFGGFEVYVEDEENVFECFIWMNYEYDPPRLIASNIRLNEDEAIMASINDFATWYNNYINEQEKHDWLNYENNK